MRRDEVESGAAGREERAQVTALLHQHPPDQEERRAPLDRVEAGRDVALEIFCCELPVREKSGVCRAAFSDRRLTLSPVKSSLRHSSNKGAVDKLFSVS